MNEIALAGLFVLLLVVILVGGILVVIRLYDEGKE